MPPLALERIRAALAAGKLRKELALNRRAAVALILTPTEPAGTGISLLLVRRAAREGDPWSGHMALPGGHADPGDVDLLQTAQRETLEEVGIDLSGAAMLGQLDDISPLRSSDIAVRPFVFWLSAPLPLTLSDEVAEALWVPLDSLASLKSAREVAVRGATLRVPAYVVDERVVWGMTFHLLERFLAEVSGELASY